MKRTLTSILLILSLLFSTVSFSACSILGTENKQPENVNKDDANTTPDTGKTDGNKIPSQEDIKVPMNVQEMLEGKYSDFEIPREKLLGALEDALAKIDYALPTFTNKFPNECSKDNVYPAIDNNDGRSTWTTGFWTGILWHAYELAELVDGDDITRQLQYKKVANGQVPTFYQRIEEKNGVNHHDMGFLYTPSCVAAYKLAGNETGKEAALMAADHLITRYHEEAEFIQAWGNVGADDNYRLIVDCLLNIPLLYWATEVTGDEKYADIAYKHFLTTVEVCYREDGSTYHTYYFDQETGEPLYGATAQGASDESTWARGQAWGMYGPMLTYIYVQDEKALETFITAANYYLSYLPSDYVAYWDLSFGDGAYEPKDSSSAAIAVCAMLEAIKHMDENDPQRRVFVNACNRIMNSLIDSYTTKNVPEANGLLLHGTYSKPGNNGIDEMTTWGDYFYMEALHRMLDPEWELYW